MTRRIFLAIPAPSEIHEYLNILKRKNQHIPGIKWMKDHNLHLTIYFIGNIDDSDFNKVTELVTQIVSSTEKFSFQFEKIYFAPQEKPKMIWARFQRSKTFTGLSDNIHKVLQSVLPENKFHYKEPVPHITLARFHPIKQLEKFDLPDLKFGKELPVSEIQLLESVSTPEGVRYDPVGPIFYLS